MCKAHWNQYTAGLAREAKARKTAEGGAAAEASVPPADTADPQEGTAATADAAPTRKRRAETAPTADDR